ncbi:MAG: CPBP family intramembrane metalloprotease [Aquabacterium sp.]|uniref:CPBP family intramembrane glutamic endopeptidase n=1 Tax=Aquabacterium sp. TaxID=1872578 RepID=UPI002715A43E|nr:CPBP family intramembrane glutamic endopeptidase [Aquabacterium sp.]MDO9004172.1 CPBP family intramembrane metalloprotease [Aquabacterium sp.]
MPPERTTFPSAPQAAFLLLAGFVLQYILGAALYDFRDALGLTDEQLLALAMLLANGILITAAMHIRGMGYRELVHPSKVSPWSVFIFLVPPILLLIPFAVLLDVSLISAIESVLPISAWEQQAFAAMVRPTLPAFIATCVIAPVVEEMLFRGILLRSFLDRYPRGLAIGYSALYFGAAHLNIYQFLLAFLLGLLMGWLYERSRSLIPCVALHAAINSTVFLWVAPMETEASLAPSAIPGSVWLAAIFAATIGAIALRRLLTSSAKSVAEEA